MVKEAQQMVKVKEAPQMVKVKEAQQMVKVKEAPQMVKVKDAPHHPIINGVVLEDPPLNIVLFNVQILVAQDVLLFLDVLDEFKEA